MAEEHHNKGSHEYESAVVDHDRKEDAVESKDRGLFADLLGKKEEKKPQEEVIGNDQFEEKVAVSEAPEPKVEKEEYKEEEKKHDLLDQKLSRSKSSSSSVSIHLYIFALSVTVDRLMNQYKSVLIINNFVLILI